MNNRLRQRTIKFFIASILMSDLTEAEINEIAKELSRGVLGKEIGDILREMTMVSTRSFGVTSRLRDWYSRLSAVIHGQIPGAWIEHNSLSEIMPIKSTQTIVVDEFREGEEILHRFFLCATGRLLWDSFSPSSKTRLLHGLTGNLKTALALDSS
jgi:hypothetical protein